MLINCVVYQEGKKLSDIPVQDISQNVEKPDCFVWVALRDASDAELATMQQEFALHDLAVEDASRGHQRPKVEEYGDTLFVVVHMLELDALDQLHVGEVDVFVGPNFVLTVRNRSHHSLLGVRARAEREPHLLRHGAGFVLYGVMDVVVDRYFPVIESLESETEAIEAAIFDGRCRTPQCAAALRAQAAHHDRQARRHATAGVHRQALERTRAGGVRGQPGVLPATSTTTCSASTPAWSPCARPSARPSR